MKNVLTLLFILSASVALAQGNATTIIKVKKILMEWIAIGSSIALTVAGGVWIIGDLLKVKAFQHSK